MSQFNKDSKTDRLYARISPTLKAKFFQWCKENGHKPSDYLTELIRRHVSDDPIDKVKDDQMYQILDEMRNHRYALEFQFEQYQIKVESELEQIRQDLTDYVDNLEGRIVQGIAIPAEKNIDALYDRTHDISKVIAVFLPLIQNIVLEQLKLRVRQGTIDPEDAKVQVQLLTRLFLREDQDENSED